MKLSIVIPAHNEEHRLPAMLEAYAAFFAGKYGGDVELIVVPNFCDDRTAEVARAIAARYPQIKVLDDPGRVGKGGAVVAGVKVASGEWIGFVDADGATCPEEFGRLAKVARSSDGVIGSRWMKKSEVNVRQTGVRLLSSRLFNGLIRLLLGLRYVDTQCGAKIFRAEAWRTILPDIGITRFAFDVDVLFQMQRHGFSVKEEPTVWNDVEGSKVRVLNTSLEMFLAVLRMRLLFSPFKMAVRWYDRTMSKAVEFLLADRLFRHAALLFSASIITMFCNMGFQMVVGRVLPDREYALLAVLLALIAVLQWPLSTLTNGLTHFVSLMFQEGKEGLLRRLLCKWTLLCGSVSIVFAAAIFLSAPHIAAYFHLERLAPIVVFSLALPVLFIMPVFSGVLRGMQRFGAVSASVIAGAVVRFGAATVFVCLIYSAAGWALLGHVVGMYAALFVITIFLVSALPAYRSQGALPRLRFYLARSVLVQLAFALLMTGDVIFVKHFLPSETGFARAATLGRMVTFMALSVTVALFPKVSSARAFNQEHKRLYFRALLYSAGFISISLAVCLLLPGWMLRFVFGMDAPDAALISQVRGMALAMAPATLLNVNVNLLLAQRRFSALNGVLVMAVVYIAGVYFMHNSVFTVIWWCGLANLVSLGWTTAGILKKGGTANEKG